MKITNVEYIYSLGRKNIKATIDGEILWVPINEKNRHYQAIQKWIAEGNTVIDNGGNN
jgi:hypothetical protein